MDVVMAVIMGLVGLVVGGMINALADDLPVPQNPRWPHYPDGTPRPLAAWLGLTAFLTGTRVSPRADNSMPEVYEPANLDADPPPARHLSWRYPLVEIVTALAFAAMTLAFNDETNLPVWFVWVAVMILITVIDIEHRLILFVVILPSCIFALVVAALSPENDKPFSDFVMGGVLGFALFFAMFLGGVAFSTLANTGEIAFGFGDVMLATLSGLILGWRAFIFASLITVFVGAFGAVVYLVGRTVIRRRHRWFTPLPYGPYIVVGTLVMLLFRDDVARLLGAS
jgi:leader peptidase (prepilin peptidase)/N-methyltransferase